MKTEFETIPRAEYEEIKKEMLLKFNFISIRRNNQNYAMGGFSISPKDYNKGFTPKQINELSDYLKKKKIDTQSLDILEDGIYDDDKGEFAGTKKNHLCFKDGINFLMKIKELNVLPTTK